MRGRVEWCWGRYWGRGNLRWGILGNFGEISFWGVVLEFLG